MIFLVIVLAFYSDSVNSANTMDHKLWQFHRLVAMCKHGVFIDAEVLGKWYFFGHFAPSLSFSNCLFCVVCPFYLVCVFIIVCPFHLVCPFYFVCPALYLLYPFIPSLYILFVYSLSHKSSDSTLACSVSL